MINCDHVGCDEMAVYYVHESGHERPFYLCMNHWVLWMKDCDQPEIKEVNYDVH